MKKDDIFRSNFQRGPKSRPLATFSFPTRTTLGDLADLLKVITEESDKYDLFRVSYVY